MTIPEQNTPEWEKWRKDKVGASDLPIIMGLSPYSTPLSLWKKKLGFEKSVYHAGMRFGHENEPVVRERANIKFGERFDPVCGVHSMNDWAIASLDGISEDGHIIEIKSCNADDHALVVHGQVPEKYFPQLQWQMYVFNKKYVTYISSHKGDDLYLKVERDQEFIDKAIPMAEEFHSCLVTYTEPEANEKDHITIDDPGFAVEAVKWIQAKLNLEEAKKQEKHFRDQLISFTDDGNCEGAGVRMTRVNQKGNIEWDKVCLKYKIDKEDLEEYRKEQIGFWRISIIE